MWHVTHMILLLVYCVLGIVVILRYNGYNSLFKTISLYLASIIFLEGIKVVLAFLKLSTVFHYKLQFLMSLFFFFMVVHRFGLTGKRKKYAQLLGLQFAFFWLLSVMFDRHSSGFPTVLFTSVQFCYILCSLLGLLELLQRTSPIPLTHQGVFWFFVSHFCFYCYSFLCFGSRSMEQTNNEAIHVYLVLFGNMVLYGVLTVVMALQNNRYFARRHDV